MVFIHVTSGCIDSTKQMEILHKNRIQFPEDCFRPQIRPPMRHVKTNGNVITMQRARHVNLSVTDCFGPRESDWLTYIHVKLSHLFLGNVQQINIGCISTATE